MAHILLGLLRYFNIYPVCDVWRKVCQKKVVIFNFRRRRGIYLDSTLTILKPSKSGGPILFETFLGLNIFRLIQCKNKFFNYISCSFNFLCCSLIVFRFKFMLHECHISLMLQFSFCFARDLYFLAILIPNLCCCTTVFPLVLI